MVYGSTGLGKTHLLHAIGIEIKKNFPNKTVLYVPSEKFINQFIKEINGAILEFRPSWMSREQTFLFLRNAV
jgi:chromosomal replication initiator protein